MGITVDFDLTPAQMQEALRYVGTGKGLFAGWKRSLMDKAVTQLAPRLAGPTTVELSEAGLRITTADGVQELAWTEVAMLNERRHGWAVQHRPRGVSFIPASAIDPDERAAFARQLRTWAGSKYKVREGGVATTSGVTG
ncbi:YcxB family protein [Streptacidiphilus sp. 4-A2]|nr:YcxB family protein [Streptacidiphilus sp. 4-A2]